jgi:hypothetical protein
MLPAASLLQALRSAADGIANTCISRQNRCIRLVNTVNPDVYWCVTRTCALCKRATRYTEISALVEASQAARCHHCIILQDTALALQGSDQAGAAASCQILHLPYSRSIYGRGEPLGDTKALNRFYTAP